MAREEGFVCKQCGHCCISLPDAYGCNAYEEDIDRWELEDRFDILKWVEAHYTKEGELIYADLWISPYDGEEVDKCPWLRKKGKRYYCKIHDTKPYHCAAFPKDKEHAKGCGCRGYDND